MQFKLKDKDRVECLVPIQKAGTEYKFVEVAIGYNLGGMNWFSGTPNKRGYYLYFSPCNVTQTASGGTVRSSTMLGTGWDSGGKITLKEVARFSQKDFQTLVRLIEPHIEELVGLMVLEQNGELIKKAMSLVQPFMRCDECGTVYHSPDEIEYIKGNNGVCQDCANKA